MDADKHGEFGRVLRKLREKRGLGVSQLADKAGIFQSNLSNMELGRIRVGPKVFTRLRRALAQSEADKNELELAFAASQVGESAPDFAQVRTEILVMLTLAFRGAGIGLRDLQSIEVAELPRLHPDSRPTRIWIAYERGTKPKPDHIEKIAAAHRSEESKRSLLLAIVRRNGRAALVQIRDLVLTT